MFTSIKIHPYPSAYKKAQQPVTNINSINPQLKNYELKKVEKKATKRSSPGNHSALCILAHINETEFR